MQILQHIEKNLFIIPFRKKEDHKQSQHGYDIQVYQKEKSVHATVQVHTRDSDIRPLLKYEWYTTLKQTILQNIYEHENSIYVHPPKLVRRVLQNILYCFRILNKINKHILHNNQLMYDTSKINYQACLPEFKIQHIIFTMF